ncbi:MAG: impB/mucB/samB family protein [Alphaproteobacteria bacterium]|nr:impB/mucB/samB family protein [Alphaproteobacteria bacterium]MBU0797477.1 impB/mucB/samB family protein [Alphaproteobacteria bacterium]MBU0889214.1 impB/mucB/samB family protein [Alphaproteobacteria bacterium]MBU1813803.1 impB/mucB/samB family protein [Alphaproteobacteria bacterium]MBU2091098.1 impB/mucB/samB family protein [Alphaproteobacteria bacterium]
MLPRSPHLKWLFLDLNAYFASVEQQARPELRGRPVGVLPLQSEGTCIIAASYEAKAFGIKTGTPVREARQLCPDIQLVPARHELYVKYHHLIVAEIDRHIPIAHVGSIDEVACELLGPQRERPAAMALARQVKRGILDRVGECLRCSIGIAPNRFGAKVASDMQKPDGLTVIEPGEMPDRLFTLELRDLAGIGANMERRLNAAGIHSVRDLAGIAPKHARQIWGSVAGERFWYGLQGVDVPMPGEVTDRHSIGHSRILPPALRPPEEARQVARRLLAKAAVRLRRYGCTARVLVISARLESGAGWAIEARFAPTQDSVPLLAALERGWPDLTAQHGRPRLKKVGITLLGLAPLAEYMPDLFATADPAWQHRQARLSRLSGAMDTLNRRFGSDTVMLGLLPAVDLDYAGAKVAFNRIPETSEFTD